MLKIRPEGCCQTEEVNDAANQTCRRPARPFNAVSGKTLPGPIHALREDQRGITGLETAIILIAFMVVASVFAFSILSSGVLATEETKKTVLGGLEEVSSSLVLRGSVIGIATTATTSTPAYLTTLKFQVTTQAISNASVDLSPAATQITYIDSVQTRNLPDEEWSATWLVGGTGDLLDASERVEIEIDLSDLDPHLEANTEFTIQVKPTKGGVLVINRTTPPALSTVMDLH